MRTIRFPGGKMITASNSTGLRRVRGLGGVLAVIAACAIHSAAADDSVTNPDHYVTLTGIYTKPDSNRGAIRGYGASLAYAGKFWEDHWWELRFQTSILDTGAKGQIDFYQSGIGLDLLQPLGHPGNGDLFLLGGIGGMSNSVSPSSESGLSAAIDVGLGWRSRTATFWGMRPRAELRFIHDTFQSGQNDFTFGIALEIPPRPERIVERTVQVERVETVKVPVEVEKVVEKTNVCVVPVVKTSQAGTAAPAAAAPVTIAEADADSDGVPDSKDKCATTLKGAKVGADGCVAEEQTLVLAGVEFEQGSATLTDAGRQHLDPVVAFLSGQASLAVDVYGHTDASGSAKKNQKLSEDRAKAVADYLAGHGIAADRVSSQGFGSSKPVASSKTAKGRTQNRRVELHVRAPATAGAQPAPEKPAQQ